MDKIQHSAPPQYKLLRGQVDDLEIAPSQFMAIELLADGFRAVISGGAIVQEVCAEGVSVEDHLVAYLQDAMRTENTKIVGAALVSANENIDREVIAERLWLELDIVPFLYAPLPFATDTELAELATWVSQQVDKNNVFELDVDATNEVHPTFLTTLAAYKAITPPEQWVKLLDLAKQYQGKSMVFVNATPRGGGVALMRHALIRLYELLGVDAHWHVLLERREVFDITKTKIHNILQAVADPGVEITQAEINLYHEWTQENYRILKPAFEKADVVIIDDPQPAGLISLIRQDMPDKKILYRSHIQIVGKLASTPHTPQAKTWNFLWEHIRQADSFLAHPVREFVPTSVPDETVLLMPATTDPLDGLNKPLNTDQVAYYRDVFNRTLIENGQTALDPERDFIAQVARFDPSKGIPDVVESYRELCEKLTANNSPVPQLVIAGHGSIDDPDGAPILAATLNLLRDSKYKHLADDVKVARLHHVDQLLDFLLQEATVVLQLSHKEGFEVKVSEALMMGRPVISYRAGGIPLQIVDGESGFVVDTIGDTQAVADHLYTLFTDTHTYERMSSAAIEKARKDVTTVSNAITWLWLSLQVLDESTPLPGDFQAVYELIFAE